MKEGLDMLNVELIMQIDYTISIMDTLDNLVTQSTETIATVGFVSVAIQVLLNVLLAASFSKINSYLKNL